MKLLSLILLCVVCTRVLGDIFNEVETDSVISLDKLKLNLKSNRFYKILSSTIERTCRSNCMGLLEAGSFVETPLRVTNRVGFVDIKPQDIQVNWTENPIVVEESTGNAIDAKQNNTTKNKPSSLNLDVKFKITVFGYNLWISDDDFTCHFPASLFPMFEVAFSVRLGEGEPFKGPNCNFKWNSIRIIDYSGFTKHQHCTTKFYEAEGKMKMIRDKVKNNLEESLNEPSFLGYLNTDVTPCNHDSVLHKMWRILLRKLQ